MTHRSDPTLDALLASVRSTREKRRRRRDAVIALSSVSCVAIVALLTLRLGGPGSPAAPTPPQPSPGPIAKTAQQPSEHADPETADGQLETLRIVRTGASRTGLIRVAQQAGPERVERLTDEMVLEKLRSLGKPAGIIRVGNRVYLDAPWLQANAGTPSETSPMPGDGGV